MAGYCFDWRRGVSDRDMNQESKPKAGFYFAPDPHPSSSEFVIWECAQCDRRVTLRVGETGPSPWDGGGCSAGRTHFWIQK